MAHVAFEDIAIEYGNYTILKNLSFEINKGEIVSLFGPSGCGKTSVMKALLGIVETKHGEIKIDKAHSGNYNKIVGYVPQDNQLLPWLTIEENIELWRYHSKNQNEDSTTEILKIIGLHEHRNKLPKELSGGMQRRTALARGLVTNTEILCLDEVLVSIERGMRRDLMIWMRDYIKKNNITTLLISHDYEETVFMSDKVYVFSPSPTVILKTVEIKSANRDIYYFTSKEFDVNAKKLVN